MNDYALCCITCMHIVEVEVNTSTIQHATRNNADVVVVGILRVMTHKKQIRFIFFFTINTKTHIYIIISQ